MSKKISLSLLPLIAIICLIIAFGSSDVLAYVETRNNLMGLEAKDKRTYKQDTSFNQTASATQPSATTTKPNNNIPPNPAPQNIGLTPPPISTHNIHKRSVVQQHDSPEDHKALELAYKQKEQGYKQQQAELVDALLSLDYHTQSPPEKLYNRAPSITNKHIPPIYFKSYYLALAFKAAATDDLNGLNALLAEDRFLNGQNQDGDTILMTAIQNNSLNTARLLVAKGAYLDAINYRRRTALHYAATLGELDLIKLLLSMGADYTLTDDRNMTAIEYASATGQHEAAQMIMSYANQDKVK